MNKKANIFMGLVVFLLIYVTGVLFLPFFTDDITTTRNQLDCTNTTISDGTKLMCLGTDILVPYIILFIISAGFGYLVGSNT